MTSITAVLFDLGGTLFGYDRRDQLHRPATVALERMGFSPDDPAVVAARRMASEQVEREYAVKKFFLHRDLFRDRVARTAQLLGATAPSEVLDRFDEENRQAIVENLLPQDDARQTLEELRARGVYVAIVSNADDDYLQPLVERHGFDQLLDSWTSSEEARSCKPDRGIYDYALSRAGRTPEETLFVGDSPQHDVAGAQAVGMRTVLIGEPGTVAPLSRGLATPAAADFTVRRLLEVVDIVDRSRESR